LNLNGGLSACLQSNEVLEQITNIDKYVSMNILANKHNILEEGTWKPLAQRTINIPSSISTDMLTSVHVTSTMAQTDKDRVPIVNSENVSVSCKPLTKSERLTAHS
jgi:hypothetical protein